MENATVNVFHAKNEFWEAWEWIKAIDAFDFNDPKHLADLLLGDRPIPEELRPILAKIVTGERKPNKKAAAKLRTDPIVRMEVAVELSVLLGIVDLGRKGPHVQLPEVSELVIEPGTPDYELIPKRLIEHLADTEAVEVKSVQQRLESTSHKILEDAAKTMGVSVHTLNSWLRDFRKKVSAYPDI